MEESIFFKKLPKQLRDDLSCKVQIDQVLQDISVSNLDSSFTKLCSLGDIKNKEFLDSVSRSLNTYLFIHSQSALLYSELFNLLVIKINQEISENHDDPNLIDLKNWFIDSIFRMCQFSFTNDQNRVCAYFIGLLIQNGHIPITYASTILNTINDQIVSSDTAAGCIFFLFGCCRKLNEADPILMNQFFDALDNKITSFQKPAFSILKELKEIRKDNFKVLQNYRYDTKFPILNHAIHFDDADFIQDFFCNPQNDINMEYPISLFEPWFQKNELLPDPMIPIRTIDAAALYGSVKCFKYLLLNGADISNCRRFAINGGNIEIIRIIEQRKPYEIESLFQAVELHRYEAFIWLFESKGFVTDESPQDDENPQKSEDDENPQKSKNDENPQKSENESDYEEVKNTLKLPILIGNRTLLHSAAMTNSIRCSLYILDRSLADINAANSFGVTPLMRAAANGNLDLARILLSVDGVDVSATDRSNNTLLHLSVKKDDTKMVNLFSPFFDINIRNSSNQTPLSVAAISGASRCVSLLLGRPDVDLSVVDGNMQLSPFLLAVYSKSLACAKLLFATNFFDINDISSQRSALLIAALNGDVEMVEYILTIDGVDVNKVDQNLLSPLFMAIDSASIGCVRLLLNRPEIELNRVNKLKETPLLYACSMLDRSAHRDEYVEIVKILVGKDGVELNCRDAHGRTPLMVATAFKSDEIVSFLLKIPGVDVGAKEKVSIC